MGVVLGDHAPFGIVPGAGTDAVAGVHRRLTGARLGREDRHAKSCRPSDGGRQVLTMFVGAREAAEIAAMSPPTLVTKKFILGPA
jgi:hypothetical protein